MTLKIIPTLGIASSMGGPSITCKDAPQKLKISPYSQLFSGLKLKWEDILEVSNEYKNSLNILNKQSCVISQFSQQQCEDNSAFLVLGGDHSVAVGTWAGVMNYLPRGSSFALLWIDAHMDAHTLHSSPTGNLHGMPVSLLLGQAEHELQSCFPSQNFIEGRDLYMFGVRSFEAEELVLLSKNKVNVFATQRIEEEGGTKKVLSELINSISRCYDYFALSIDLDAIDPKDAPGVETRAESGLTAKSLLETLEASEFTDNFLGLEIAEFDPQQDVDDKTEKLVFEIIKRVFKLQPKD